jgi:sec-independent protein translocase protein TatA
MGKLGLPELILIVGIAFLIFGPSKFASLGKGLGEGLRNFKSAVKEEDKKDEEKKDIDKQDADKKV